MAKDTSPIVELHFPVGGLNRAVAFQNQPPYTTPYCQNVRPYDQIFGRVRGGSRPGLVLAYAEQLGGGGGTAPQLLGSASVLPNTGIATNRLVAVVDGMFYYLSDAGAMTQCTGVFNSTNGKMQGTQIGQLYYVADFAQYNLAGSNGTLVTGHSLTDPNFASWPSWLTGDLADYCIWISGADPAEENIFPIASIAGATITFTTTGVGDMTAQSGGVTWQIGRMPKVFDPAGLTISKLAPTPIPSTQYTTGVVSITNGVVTLAGGTFPTLTAAQLTAGVILTIPNASGIGTQDYLVASQGSSTSLTLTDTTNDANCSAVTYKLAWTGTYYGVPPLGCNLCCTYRGRLVLAGPGAVWYMSRVLVPTDWDYGYDPADPSRAVGGTATTTGGIPEPILALMPHSDDYLIFGCEHSLWVLNGDPAYGGTITALSRDIGVLGPNAWCNLPDGSMVIFSRDGLYLVPAGAQGVPQAISRPLLPVELVDVDWQANTISLAYDIQARGLHISVTPNSGATGIYYFLDWVNKGFWPVTFGSTSINPTTMIRFAASSAQPGVVVYGCLDGCLRKYDASAQADAASALNDTVFYSILAYGPIRIGGPGYDGQIVELSADFDSAVGSDAIAWGVFAGDTAQQAVAAAAAFTWTTLPLWGGDFGPNRNSRQCPMSRGAAQVIVLYAQQTTAWAIESLRIVGKRKGRLR